MDVSTINPEDEEKDEKKQREDQVVVLGVNAGDSLYAEVRDQHVEKFGSFLQNQAMALRESHANFTNKETKKDLTEIHQFVKQIPVSCAPLSSICRSVMSELVLARPSLENRFSHKTCEV